MQIVYSLEEPPKSFGKSLFLAGPTPRAGLGEVSSWRPQALELLRSLRFNGTVFVPENRNNDFDQYDKELYPKWERRMLNMASAIVFWVPRNMKTLPGLTTNIEYGLYAKSGKIVLGAPPEAENISYFDGLAEELIIPRYSDLPNTLLGAMDLIEKLSREEIKLPQFLNYQFCPFCSLRLKVRFEESKPLKHCKKCNWTHYPAPHIAVAAVITEIHDDKPSILMVRRKREPFKDTWMFPAGFLEFGEHPEQDTLPRELMEEVGLTRVRSKVLQILKASSDPRSPDHLVIFYHVETSGNITNNDENENSDIQWKSINEKIGIGFPHHQAILDHIRDRSSEFFT